MCKLNSLESYQQSSFCDLNMSVNSTGQKLTVLLATELTKGPGKMMERLTLQDIFPSPVTGRELLMQTSFHLNCRLM